MNLIPDIIMKKITSLAQIERHHSGEWENEILELGEPYGVVDAKKERVLDPLTDKWFELDARLGDILIELTTSCGDTKEAKIIREATLFKENNPGSKFVVCLKRIKSNKGKGRVSDGKDSHYDHLIKHPDIDNVLVGEEEIIKFFIKPTWDKQEKINKLKNKNKKILSNKGESNMKFDQLVIREAMKTSDMDPVSFLLAYGSSNTTYVGDMNNMSKAEKRKARQIDRRVSLCENALTISDLKGEPTQSVRQLAETHGKQADLGKFINSAMATRMIEDKVKMVQDTDAKYDRDRWHITQSVIDKYGHHYS